MLRGLDTTSNPVSAEVGAGSTTVTATINSGGDCLIWLAQVFSVTSAAVIIPPVVIPPAKGSIDEGTHAGATGPTVTFSSNEGTYGHGGRGLVKPCKTCRNGANFGDSSATLFGPIATGSGNLRVFNIAASQQRVLSPTNPSEEEFDIVIPLSVAGVSILALAAYLLAARFRGISNRVG